MYTGEMGHTMRAAVSVTAMVMDVEMTLKVVP